MENVVSFVTNEDLARKKKKKHIFEITFAKEALNNFSDIPTDGTSKKLITWAFAIQQSEEYKNWMDTLSTVMDSIQANKDQGTKPGETYLTEANKPSNFASRVILCGESFIIFKVEL